MEPRQIRVIREGEVAYLLDEAGQAPFYPESANLPDAARALLARYPSVPLLALVFAAMVAPLKFVDKIVCLNEVDSSIIWTIVNDASTEQRYQIYDIQWDVLHRFAGKAADFRLVDKTEYPIDELPEWDARALVLEVGYADTPTA
jgi:hypothetical protein